MTHELTFRIPGSTSNLGPGFDSIGVAINLYLELTIVPSDKMEFIAGTPDLQTIIDQSDNLIRKTAEEVGARYNRGELPSYVVKVSNDIPLARGLGSSAAAIVSGIELANHAYDLQLSEWEKVQLATDMEGHPDNVVPSIVGGCVVAHYDGKEVSYQRLSIEPCRFIAMIPEQELKTSEARSVLPREMSYSNAVAASSVANVLVAAIATGNWALAGRMMEKDRFHQSYRKPLVPHFESLQQWLESNGAFGTFLSGAGPTILSLVDASTSMQILQRVQSAYPAFSCKVLQEDQQGLEIMTVENSNEMKS
ncbi:homoserine kinase [Pontibacillus salicampi]|uniref:Homoserine kinase n=1 Tax=Pontibacillus salicampi TaxID=1449801 RepID=A0ABV6LNI5_9BACI